ncbi:phospholipase D-like domain-containing protein [Ornithinicoccus hortensis]|uniref:Cardiolipin synthase n=1 Tax=Ornithinicoccus hortensis TaxID=82346 RepID=A0A542YQ24_9MICO|nr:phospholipase D-like domain-containing protein [Ornithinicoccus hortensis]TQL50205.1 cardiolipin synthase [Ornithinicoccus hortensis]
MSILRSRVRSARRVLVGAAAATFAAQLVAAGTVVGVDALRKRRTTEAHGAPDHEPSSTAVGENAVTTYTYGEHLYDAMLEAIDGATEYVYLASYIWKGDDLGQRFKDALIAAAGRGVQVCVVFDGFANVVVPREFKKFPEPLAVLKFPTVRGGFLLNLRRTGRDHRKILVVDGRVGFVGGYNIGGLYATQWRDTHVRVEGPSVWELTNTFVDFWNRHRKRIHPDLPNSGNDDWTGPVRAARNEPSRLVYPVRGIYLEAIDRATQRVWITQGYFIPDREIVDGLLTAAERGVDVRVIMPAVSNHVIADWVARSRFSELLRGGVRLYLYEGAMVHAKTATVDGRWSTVGTANIDRLSLLGNYEVNLEFRDRDHAAEMEAIFRRDLENCHELTAEEWADRSLLARVAEGLLDPFSPLL